MYPKAAYTKSLVIQLLRSKFFNKSRADRTVSPFLIPSPQRFTHRGAGVCFRHGIEVAIDIRRSEHQKSSHLMGRL